MDYREFLYRADIEAEVLDAWLAACWLMPSASDAQPTFTEVDLARARLIQDLRGFPGPRLLTGDLNMTPHAVRRCSGMRPLAVAATFPAETPDRQLDHILTDDHRLRGCAVEAELMPISDHRPLVLELECE